MWNFFNGERGLVRRGQSGQHFADKQRRLAGMTITQKASHGLSIFKFQYFLLFCCLLAASISLSSIFRFFFSLMVGDGEHCMPGLHLYFDFLDVSAAEDFDNLRPGTNPT